MLPNSHYTLNALSAPKIRKRQIMHTSKQLFVGLVLTFAATTTQAQKFEDWEVTRTRDLITATTENNSDSVLGYSCVRSSNECQFFFMPDGLKCTEGSSYALLMNGGKENSYRRTICRKLSGTDGQQLANVLDGTDGLRKQLLSADGASVGIARGTGADSFSTSKFSMRGFRAAYEKVNRHRDDSSYRDNSSNSDVKPVVKAPDVELYEHSDFKGRRLNVRANLEDLGEFNFNDMVSSLVVNRGRWELCTKQRYRGSCRTYAPGRYDSVGDYNDEYSSMRRID
jgi:Beta/Gamma crystallin